MLNCNLNISCVLGCGPYWHPFVYALCLLSIKTIKANVVKTNKKVPLGKKNVTMSKTKGSHGCFHDVRLFGVKSVVDTRIYAKDDLLYDDDCLTWCEVATAASIRVARN